VAEVAKLLKRKRSAALLHCDAVQGFLKVPFTTKELGVDFLAVSAHKIHAPKGIGALYVRRGLKLPPMILGGGQENGLRSGTEATAQIAGFAKAVELRLENHTEKLAKMAELKAYCLEKMLSIPTMVQVGRGEAPHILSLSLPGYPSANIVTDLGAKGICISAGSACHKGKSSHVVSALGLDKRTAAGVIRLSFGPETTVEDIDAAYEALREHKEKRFAML
jgi:cysteine desulfurase